ncbi:hypothetical protein WME75_41485 [Sorangium sp. So ce1014]|uniref:hypothetical protein n=1 Tax=Sorangium sp. So ce1014 TaxID=3133326 RepID=UPI003F61A459
MKSRRRVPEEARCAGGVSSPFSVSTWCHESRSENSAGAVCSPCISSVLPAMSADA